ncbi:hypothetical protein PMAYCL1PPCAC_22274, partial [Pristionchus mayeri]
RWTCIDSTLKVNLDYNPGLYRLHCFNHELTPFTGLSCVDMGPKHSACTEPWAFAGVRKANRYECKKGYFLKWIDSKDAQGVRRTTNADQSDTQSMQCNRDGWHIMGTSLTGLKVIGFYCEEVSPSSGDSPCAALNVDFEYYTLKFDFFR